MRFCVIKSKRVPSDLNTPEDGGSINFIELIKRLKNDGHFIKILTRNEKNHTKVFKKKIKGIEVVYLPFKYSPSKKIMERDFYEGKSFVYSVNKHLSKSSDFDVIHTHHWTSGIGLEKKASLWVHTPHLLAYAKKNHVGYDCSQVIINNENKILSNCDKIISLSCTEKNDIMEKYGINTDKIIVIPNGIAEPFQALTPLNPYTHNRTFKIVTVARITKQKRLDTLIYALAYLKNNNISVKLKIIGGKYYDNDYYEYIMRLIDEFDLSNHIQIIGFINQKKMSQIYRDSDLYIQSSHYESQGIAIIEAMACGLPVISTYQEALEEYFVVGENGFFYKVEDYKKLVSKIEKLIKNRELYKKISENNISKSSKFKWKYTYNRSLEIFREGSKQKRNKKMLSQATSIGSKYLSKELLENIAITGSIAKGNTWTGSDIDFIALKEIEQNKEVFIFESDRIENTRYITEKHAVKILKKNNPKELANFLYDSNIGEYLWKSVPLLNNNDLLNKIINKINRSRQKPEYIQTTIQNYLQDFDTKLAAFYKNVNKSNKYEATLMLRKALLKLKCGFMVSKGWVLQGSKKRPEQLAKYCKTNIERHFKILFKEVNGLNTSLVQILKITNIRQELRSTYYDLLLEKKKSSLDNDFFNKEIAHNKNSKNYYLENLRNGYEKGALYHLRIISSFPHYLNKYCYALTGENFSTIDNLLTCKEVSEEIKEKWLFAMNLETDKACQWANKLVKFKKYYFTNR